VDSQTAIVVIVDDDDVHERLVGDLSRRFAADYAVRGVRSTGADAALSEPRRVAAVIAARPCLAGRRGRVR
jgi:hypothetical protein